MRFTTRATIATFTIAGIIAGAALWGRFDTESPSAPLKTPERAAPYRGAVIFPAVAEDVRRSAVLRHYEQWKNAFLRRGCGAGMYRVYSPDAAFPYVAEGQGYGMNITVSLASLDPRARTIFDGILSFVLDHPSSNDPDLTASEQDQDCADQAGADSATDGDMDIAYALLLADRAWGSTGKFDYRRLALRRIEAIKRSEIHPETKLTLLGDWSKKGSTLFNASRTSDWMLEHFRAFGRVTGDTFWGDVLLAHQNAISEIQERYSPGTGLLPDFVVADNRVVTPADGRILESDYDGTYFYNACRTPWRIGVDALINVDPASSAAVRKMVTWFRLATKGNPDNLRPGYWLDGRPYGSGSAQAFWAPLAVAAMTEASSQNWLDALWNKMADSNVDGENYFGATLQLQAMIVVSGMYQPA